MAASPSPGRRALVLVASLVFVALVAAPIVAVYLNGQGGDGGPPANNTTDGGGTNNTTDPDPNVTVNVTPFEPSNVTLDNATFHVDGQSLGIAKCLRYQPAPVGKSPGFGYRWAHFPENYEPDLPMLEALGTNVLVVNVLSAAEPSELYTFMNETLARDIHVILEVNGPDGQNVTDPGVEEGFLRNVTEAVRTYRDHPAVLAWQLGNEVGLEYPNASRQEEWFMLLGEAVDRVHELDPNHPVMTASSAAVDEHLVISEAPDLDVFGTNYYGTSNRSITTFLEGITDATDPRPILVTEFGIDAWDANASRENEEAQARLLVDVWEGIVHARATGTPVLGGCVHEWSDQWWKDWSPESQAPDSKWTPTQSNDLPDGAYHEEYFGLTRIQPDTTEKTPRQAYDALAEAWGGSAARSD